VKGVANGFATYGPWCMDKQLQFNLFEALQKDKSLRNVVLPRCVAYSTY
jgi:hypothetical protein